jgi:hypothetical protein
MSVRSEPASCYARLAHVARRGGNGRRNLPDARDREHKQSYEASLEKARFHVGYMVNAVWQSMLSIFYSAGKGSVFRIAIPAVAAAFGRRHPLISP